MKYLKKFNEALFQRNKILFHGKKNADDIDEELIGKTSVYFYLTDNPNYAANYSGPIDKGKLHGYEIDTTKLVDLRSLGVEKYDFIDLQKKFYKLTGIGFPPELRGNGVQLWVHVRFDRDGLIKKRLQAMGFDGMIMDEEYGRYSNDTKIFNSYVLFNKNPIIKKID